MKTKRLLYTIALLITISSLVVAAPLGTAFTYQGKLSNGGTDAHGHYDLKFTLYDSSGGATLIAGPLTNALTSVSNGYFTVALDFGNVFTGTALWLEIGVRANGGAADFTVLSPRQPLTGAPYALYAATAGMADAVAAGAVTGTGIATGQVVRSLNGLQDSLRILPGTNVSITSVGDAITIAAAPGTVVTNAGWGLTGNSGTTANNFLGTTDGTPLELRANNLRGWRLEPGGISPNVLGGYRSNFAKAGISGATIAGGGYSGYPNAVSNNYAAIAGGYGNIAEALSSFIGAGGENQTVAGGSASVIGGGAFNSSAGLYGVIGGGRENSLTGVADYGFVGGGYQNRVDAPRAAVVGGRLNAVDPAMILTTRSEADNAAIIGGTNNLIQGGKNALIGAGQTNLIYLANSAMLGGGAGNRLSGTFGFLGGGLNNTNAGLQAALVGGDENLMTVSAESSFIGAGWSNAIRVDHAVIAGGARNEVSSTGDFGTIGGGSQNKVSGMFSAIGGGSHNLAGVGYSTVPGGTENEATGMYSFAAGRRAKAQHSGAFVWADSTAADFASTGINQFLVRASEAGINTTDPQAALHINTDVADRATLYLQNSSSGTRSLVRLAAASSYADLIFEKYPTTEEIGFYLPDGTSFYVNRGIARINGQFRCQILFEESDRNRKQDVEVVDSLMVLNRVLSLPLSTWAFTNNASTRHLGPMAQDFHAAFGLGQDDTTVSARDVASVGLAAIQGLNQKVENESQKAEDRLEKLEAENAELKARLEKLEKLINQGGAK